MPPSTHGIYSVRGNAPALHACSPRPLVGRLGFELLNSSMGENVTSSWLQRPHPSASDCACSSKLIMSSWDHSNYADGLVHPLACPLWRRDFTEQGSSSPTRFCKQANTYCVYVVMSFSYFICVDFSEFFLVIQAFSISPVSICVESTVQ